MQDEVNEKTMALCIKGGKISAQLLKAALTRRRKMIESIKNRRSIRKYKSKAVVKEAIAQILQAGMLAPSSKNYQP